MVRRIWVTGWKEEDEMSYIGEQSSQAKPPHPFFFLSFSKEVSPEFFAILHAWRWNERKKVI